MGWQDAFSFDRPADIYREHARLSTYGNGGARLFDLGRHASISNKAYDEMTPWRWGGTPFADGCFPTPDGRARMLPVKQVAPAEPLARWPMTLNTGRYRDQWHSMTRTGLSPRLASHRREPLVEIHPADASAAGLMEGDPATVSHAQGESVFRVSLTFGQPRGAMFTPIHWSDRHSHRGRACQLPRRRGDPLSSPAGRRNK